MQNKVVHTLCRALQSLGAATLRFNFRGVGQSAGEWDRGTGETLDVLAACRFMRQRFPGLPLALAGFSFGAAMALRASDTAGADWLVTVAPPPRLLDVRAMPHPPSARWLLVQGRDDEIVPHAEQKAWLSKRGLAPALSEPDGVGHFFHGQLTRLRDIVVDHFDSGVQDA
ncbi:MAG: alpha/beta hydrolase [Chromatiales bacterium]|nr:alpha/beta hydrolase [Chromatiales bacterium]